MNELGSCEQCARAGGCTARHTEEKISEEISAGPYLVVSGIIIVVVSIIVRWMLQT